MPLRGWIIPVGGSTPDRHKDGTIHPRQIFAALSNSARHSPRESSYFLPLIQCPCVGGSFQSGVQPPTGTRTERSTPAKYPPPTPNPARHSLRESSCFLSFIQCSRVGGSFRSGVQPPTGTRTERSTPAKYPPPTPNPARHSPHESSCFPSFIQCPCVGGSFRSGVQPPTGSIKTGSILKIKAKKKSLNLFFSGERRYTLPPARFGGREKTTGEIDA